MALPPAKLSSGRAVLTEDLPLALVFFDGFDAGGKRVLFVVKLFEMLDGVAALLEAEVRLAINLSP